MRTWRAIFLLLLAASLAAAPAPRHAPTLRQQFQAIFRQQHDAFFVQHDAARTLQSLADDFQGIGIDGKIYSKAQAGANLNGILMRAQFLQGQYRIKEIKPLGPGVIVLSSSRLTMQIRDPRTGLLHKIVILELRRDQWVSLAGKWRLRREKQLRETIVTDGKPKIIKARNANINF